MKANDDSLEDRWRKRSKGELVLKSIKQQSAPHTHTHTHTQPAINVLAAAGKWEKGREKLIGLPLAEDSCSTGDSVGTWSS